MENVSKSFCQLIKHIPTTETVIYQTDFEEYKIVSMGETIFMGETVSHVKTSFLPEGIGMDEYQETQFLDFSSVNREREDRSIVSNGSYDSEFRITTSKELIQNNPSKIYGTG